MRFRSFVVAIAALGATLTASSAMAGSADDKKSRVEVSYNDLDLATEAGRKELSNRFDKAARDMCGVDEDGAGSRYARDCYKRTSGSLEQQVAMIVKRQQQASGG